MRKIKFRVWDKQFGRMAKKPEQIRLNIANGNVHGSKSGGNVETWVLMQFTGLKDVNGNEIYEDDIVQVSGSDGYYVTAKVVYECGAFWFYAKNISLVFEEDCDNMVMLGSMYIEHGDGGDALDMVGVVGNIYENPELLRGTTNGKD